MVKKNVMLGLLCSFAFCGAMAQNDVKYNTPGAGNPIVPGYFADPTVRKFDGLYYMYATTDGNGGGFGPSQVWVSKDFVNWCILPMNWPVTPYIWAPDVIKAANNKYYLFYSQPCEVYCGVSDSPIGPWKNIIDSEEQKPVIPNYMVKGVITLDGQTFVDDNGDTYIYWGTWGIYPDHGCGVGKLSGDFKTISDAKLIPNTQLKDFFEAPFMFKRNDIYYLTYSSGSCHDDTYRVQYATSTSGPYGPFEYADNNPILATNDDSTIHGPGHHSILVENGEYYIIYHRHNLPNSTRGMHRQIAADRMTFDEDGRIMKVEAGHKGIGYLQENANPYENLALGAKVTASSYYNADFLPEYAADNNNATLWRPKTVGEEWIELDLGEEKEFTRIWTEFEYATSYYQYIIETSSDRHNWTIFSDRRDNMQAGCPMSDSGKAKARYIRLTVTGNQENGLFGAIWNIKVFNGGSDWFTDIVEGAKSEFSKKSPAPKRKGFLFEVNAADYSPEKPISQLVARNNPEMKFNAVKDDIMVRNIGGKPAFVFTGNQLFKSEFSLGEAFVGNSPYSLNAWIYMDKISDNEYFFDFTDRVDDLRKVAIGYGSDKNSGLVAHHGSHEELGLNTEPKLSQWVLLSVVFDGYMEKVYINGEKVTERNLFLRLLPSRNVTIGGKWDGSFTFKNYLNSIYVYDSPLSNSEIAEIYANGIKDISDTSFKSEYMLMNDIKQLRLKPELKAVSPSYVRLSFNLDNNIYGLKFNYKSLTTGKESGWIKETFYYDTSLEENKKYKYEVKVRDTFGNESDFKGLSVKISSDNFYTFEDTFDKSFRYSTTETGEWDGLSGKKLGPESAVAENGCLTLSSAGTNLLPDCTDNAPVLYKEVSGDFIAEVEIKTFTGENNKKPVAFNEGGLIVSYKKPEADFSGKDNNDDEQQLVHLGVFPFYGVGNLLTDLSKGNRFQYNNKSNWSYDKYLQIERRDNVIYARTSKDGKEWVEMPGSPVICDISDKEPVRIGLYQVTYSTDSASYSFDNFKLWISK